MIKLSDFHYEREHSLDKLCAGTLSRQDFILGKAVRDFESNFAAYTQAEHAVAVGNCTDALRLSLDAVGVKPGDNVITVGLTWLSSYEVIANLGAEIRLVDVDQYLTMNMDDALNAVDSRTKAIIGVDLFGQPCDWDRVKFPVATISDAAQATGAKYNDRMVGSVTDLTCFSFYPTKNLGCLGDGGAVTTNNADYAATIKKLRNHGQESKFNVSHVGYNSRLDSIQAELLDNKLPHLDKWNIRRREISAYYDEQFKDLFDIIPQRPNSYNVRHQYIVLSDQSERIEAALKANDIESRRYYSNLAYKQPAYNVNVSLPNTEYYSRMNLAIPTHQFLLDSEVELIADIVKRELK